MTRYNSVNRPFLWIHSNYKPWGSFNVTLFSDIHTLKIKSQFTHIQCVGVAKEGYIKRALGLIIWMYSKKCPIRGIVPSPKKPGIHIATYSLQAFIRILCFFTSLSIRYRSFGPRSKMVVLFSSWPFLITLVSSKTILFSNIFIWLRSDPPYILCLTFILY